MVRLAQQRRWRCLYRSPGAAGDTNTYTDGNTDTYCHGDTYCYGNTYCYSYTNAENCANTKASSDTSAETVVAFAKAKNYRDRRRAMGDRSRSPLPLPVHAAASRQTVAEMGQNNLDTFVRIQVQGRTAVATPYSMSTTAPLSPRFIQ